MHRQQCYHSIPLETLRQEIARIEGGRRGQDDPPVSSGCEALDRILPERGLRRGTLTEWLADDQGAGATTLALLAAQAACGEGGVLVVVEGSRQFYPPAAARRGIVFGRLLVVCAGQRADHDWALDQALRCPAVAAVMAWPEAIDGRCEGRILRRLQLAAEAGGSLGLLIRPASVRHEPSWADVRLLVEPRPAAGGQNRRLRALLLHGRGGVEGRSVELEFDDESRTLRETARLARTAAGARLAGGMVPTL